CDARLKSSLRPRPRSHPTPIGSPAGVRYRLKSPVPARMGARALSTEGCKKTMGTIPALVAPTTNSEVLGFVEDAMHMLRPDAVRWCDGSTAEYDEMVQALVDAGTALRLDPSKRPNSILVRSDPADVARVEDRTFICSKNRDDAGPTNHWADPVEMKATLRKQFDGA